MSSVDSEPAQFRYAGIRKRIRFGQYGDVLTVLSELGQRYRDIRLTAAPGGNKSGRLQETLEARR
jgi:hypothetical protein